MICFAAGHRGLIDPEILDATAVIAVGRGPAGMAFAPGDPTKAYIANFADNNVSVVDLTPGGPAEFQVVQRIGFPHSAEDNDFGN